MAADAGVELRLLETVAEFDAASRLLDGIWKPTDGSQQMPVEHLRALTHAGNYAAGAYVGEELVATSVGYFGPPDERYLHSHITGVAEKAQGRGAGYALKLHQRAWALKAGVRTITWTFDPVVRRNAHFNLSKLGARPAEYYVDFYGEVGDLINAGQGSDRLLAAWDLGSERVRAALGEIPDDVGGASPALDDRSGLCAVGAAEGGPVLAAADDRRSAPYVVVETPPDIEALRRHDPHAAFAWRLALRAALADLIGSRARFVGLSPNGSYHFERNAL
ncbi:hypothetical protein GCM10010522_30070 [Kribbella solani]